MSDWDPSSYGRVNTLQELVAQQALTGLRVEGSERVLDVGCGDGRVTRLVVDRLTTGSLLGIDPSAAMVRAAAERFADDPRVEFAVGTAAELAYASQFDLVTSFNALHWERRSELALARIRAALVPNGRAFLVFVCSGERPSLEDVITRTADSTRWRRWFTGFDPPYVHVDPQAYATAAEAAGFAVEQLEVVDLDWDFGDPAAFADWVGAGTPAWTGRLPDSERADFVGDVLAGYAEVSGSPARFRFLQCRVALTAADGS